MKLTQLFLRFVKDEQIYTMVKNNAFEKYVFYDGVIENILYYNYMSIKDLFHLFGNDDQNINRRWINFIVQNKINEYVTEKVDTYTNFATKTVKDFIALYNIEEAVTTVLYVKGKIKENKINDNDIDKILRSNYDARLIDVFQSANCFCCWEDYNHVLKHTQFEHWNMVHEKWCDYISSKNYNKNIRV